MQKIIAYVCYLENTVHDLCEKLDLKVGDLLMSTDFITEQLRTKIGTSIKFTFVYVTSCHSEFPDIRIVGDSKIFKFKKNEILPKIKRCMFIHVNCYFNSRELIYITYFFSLALKKDPPVLRQKVGRIHCIKERTILLCHSAKCFATFMFDWIQ